MATIIKREVQFSLTWSKDNSDDFIWSIRTRAVVADDSEPGAEKRINAAGTTQTISRATFRTKTGQQIEDLMKAESDAILQALGSGAGGHTIQQDTGS